MMKFDRPFLAANQENLCFNARRGFTLVELSIVLVIVGLIIGGVMTGQQIIQTARITNAVNGIQAYQAQIQTYVQNFGTLPGDDKNADTRFGLGKGNGKGTIGTATSFDIASATGEEEESLLVWAHLRAAGLVKNQQSGASALQPANPFGGMYGVQNTAFKGGLSGTVICLNEVPAAAAQAIDTKLDDGKPDTGTLRAAKAAGTGHANDDAAENYAEGTYTVCTKM